MPGTDIRLGRMRDGEHQHSPGLDITLSAPKSVSLSALPHGDRRVVRAHEEAVRAVLDRIEVELLQTRGRDPATQRRPRVKAHAWWRRPSGTLRAVTWTRSCTRIA